MMFAMNAPLDELAAARLSEARGRYVDALIHLNGLRCRQRSASNYADLLNAAQRQLAEATAEWWAVFERETGQKVLNGDVSQG